MQKRLLPPFRCDGYVSPEVQGGCPVPRTKLHTKLGKRGTIVWAKLRRLRDGQGISRATMETIAEFWQASPRLPRQSIRAVELGLRQLRKAGLVSTECIYWTRVIDPTTGMSHPKKLVERMVWGANIRFLTNARDWPGQWSMVPPETMSWLATYQGRGGARQGAGRPRQAGEKFKRGVQDHIQTGGAYKTKILYPRVHGDSPRGNGAPEAGAQPDLVFQGRMVDDLAERLDRVECLGMLLTSGMPGPLLPLPVEIEVLPDVPTPTRPPEQVTPAPVITGTTSEELGLGLGGGMPPATIPEWGSNGLPPYPDQNVLYPVIVPTPPRLPAGLDDLDAAEWLMRAYHGATVARYHVRSFALARREQLAKSKYLPGIVAAAWALEQEGISPAAWAAFSLDVWREYGTGGRRGHPPPVAWVWSVKRIEEKQGWFCQESGDYSAARYQYAEVAKAFLARWGRFQMAAFRCAATGGDWAAVVERHFPGNSYQDEIDRANIEAEDITERMALKAARGEWCAW